MAKNNNLKDFVTGIASAIREKKGTTELINPQDFENEIRTIQTDSEHPSGKSLAAQIIDKSVTDVTAGDLKGAIKIGVYAFYACSDLTSITIPDSVTSVGDYAFDGCTNLGTITLPKSITNVGQYAFRSVGSSKNTPFVFEVDSACTVCGYAFQRAKVSKVKGKLTSIGNYGFASCSVLAEIDISQSGNVSSYAFQSDTAITTINIKIVGSVGDHAFYDCRAVASHALDVSSVISSLGSYAFSRYGSNRANPEQNIQIFDLRSSTFTTINQYAFGSDSSSYKNRYQRIYFPSTVTSVQQYAFRYCDNCDFYFNSETPPTMAATTAWRDATNCAIFVPYGKVNAYRTATNWTAQAANIKGYAKPNTFTVGDTLPELNAEGYELTWYSDKACTVPVSTVDDANTEYYCTAGTEKVEFGIKSVTAMDCSISIVDENDKSYVAGEVVRINKVLTITATPTTEGFVPYMFKVNGEDFTSGGTITVTGDIEITAIYWDGQNLPINPNFGDNSWVIIFNTFRAGTASQFWNVGDTKSVTSKSGKTYTLRIADMTSGRYNIAGGGTTNGVLEFVELYNLNGTSNWKINNTQKEGYWTGGGYKLSDMANIYLKDIFDDLPDDLQAAISEITLNEYSCTSPSPREATHKLFLPAETEMFQQRYYSAEGSQTGCVKYEQFDYYKANNTNAARVKKQLGSTSGAWWWLRSPCSDGSSSFCFVDRGGSYGNGGAYGTNGVAPCFAI